MKGSNLLGPLLMVGLAWSPAAAAELGQTAPATPTAGSTEEAAPAGNPPADEGETNDGKSPSSTDDAPAAGASSAPPTKPAPSSSAPANDPCQDVYDRSGGCEGLMMEPLEGVSEPVAAQAAAEDDEGLLSFLDNDLINWSLLGLSVGAVTGATAFHIVSYLYAGQLAEQARRGQIGPDALATTTNVQTALGVGAGAMWMTAALLGGTALALWAFDPETGAIRLPFFDE